MKRLRLFFPLVIAALWLGACKYDKEDYELPTDPDQGYLQVVLEATSVPADGFSTVGLTARIPAEPTQRQIKFTASLGQLIGGTGTPSALTVPADAAGLARATLKSSQDIGIARITVEVVGVPGVTQTREIFFVATDASSVLRFVTVPPSVLADGVTASPITVGVAAELPGGAGRTVTLTTNLGSFSPTAQLSTLPVIPSQVDNTATALLYSPQDVGLGVLTAEVAGVKRSTIVSFERALPERIQVDLSAISVPDSPNSSLSITGFLTRRTGRVSNLTRVIFEARASDNTMFGRFLAQDPMSDAEGRVTATFSPAGSGKIGRARIVVRSEEGGISGTASFEVTAPTAPPPP